MNEAKKEPPARAHAAFDPSMVIASELEHNWHYWDYGGYTNMSFCYRPIIWSCRDSGYTPDAPPKVEP
jgi:hypothetical protein